MKLRAITIDLYGCGQHLIMRGDRPLATVITREDADKLCEMYNGLLDDLEYAVKQNSKGDCKWD